MAYKSFWKLSIIVILICSIARRSVSECPTAVCDCSQYTSSKEIRCGNSNLNSIPTNLPADTRTLRLEYNSIVYIDADDLAQLIALKRLTIYNNEITGIHPDAFQSLVNLEYLLLQNNHIASLHGDTFSGLGKLAELKLSNNQLTTLENGTFQDLDKLVTLELKGNPFETLPGKIFRALSNLHTLDLSGANFRIIHQDVFYGLGNLRQLTMDTASQDGDEMFNSSDLFEFITNLTVLSVRTNSLSCIPSSFSVLSSLETLDLENNPLTCDNLTALRHFPALADLNLDWSRITTFRSRMFESNINLVFLSAVSTNLSTIEEDAFVGLHQLDTLYLYTNNITTLPRNIFSPLPTDVELDISDNPFHCDCNLRWLRDWLVDTHVGGPMEEQYQPSCASPDALIGLRVSSIEDTSFACHPEITQGFSSDVIHSVNIGDDLTLKCPITGDPDPSLHWLTPDHTQLLPDTNQSPYSVSVDGDLTIVRMQKQDEGTYSCGGTNFAGTVSIRNVVNVASPGDQTTQMTTRSEVINDSPTTAEATSAMQPLSKGPALSQLSMIVIIVVVIVVTAVILVLALMRCHSRKRRKSDPVAYVPDVGVIFSNDHLVQPASCNQTCSDSGFPGVSFPQDVRYATNFGMPSDKPPPYSVELPDTDEIYEHIDDTPNHYYDMQAPKEGALPIPNLQHTYMTQFKRQDSEASCGAPAGYDRFVPRTGNSPSPTNDYVTAPLSRAAGQQGGPGQTQGEGLSGTKDPFVPVGNTYDPFDSNDSLPKKNGNEQVVDTVELQSKPNIPNATYVNARRE